MPSVFIHQLLQFCLAFVGAIVLLYMIVAYYRQRMNPAQLGPINYANQIVVESVQYLEPRKNLYVVRTGQQRFLISTGEQQTQVISELKEQPQAEYDAWVESQQQLKEQQQVIPDTFSGRFVQSVKMVLNQYTGQRPNK